MTGTKKKFSRLAGTAAAAAALLAMLSLGAAARPGGRHAGCGPGFGPHAWGERGMGMDEHGFGMGEGFLEAFEDLDLSDAQRDRLRDIRRKSPGVLMPKRQAVVEARMDFQDLMRSDKADAAELRRAHERLVAARSAMQSAAFDLRLQAHEVLTAEQRAKLHELRRPGEGRRLWRERGQLRERREERQ
jgi:Spy/CpxP family protein refolding chaperone